MRRRVVLGLVLLALAARLAHLAFLRDEPFLHFHRGFTNSDMYIFDQWAQRIAAGDWLGRAVYHPLARWQLAAAPQARWTEWYGAAPVFYKGPFYAYLIAVLYRLFADPAWPLFLLQVAASTAAVALVATLTARTLGTTAGVVAGALFALYAPAIHFDAVMLRGPWVALLALVVAWLLWWLRAAPSPGRAALLGAAAGLAVVANEGFLVLPALVVACFPWRHGVARAARLGLACVAGIVVALSPVMVRNAIVGVPPLNLAVTGGTVFAVYDSVGSSPFFLDTDPAVFVPILERSHGRLVATTIECWRSFGGPGRVVAFYLRKAAGLAIPFENPDNANVYYAALTSPVLRLLPGYGLLLPLALVGLVLAWPRRLEVLPWLPSALALLIGLFVALPASRYRATFAVFLFPFAGLAAARLLELLRQRDWRRAALAVAALLAIAVAAAQLERRVVFAHASEDAIRYRPAEFFLGARMRAERGDLQGAARELLLLTRLNPDLPVEVNALSMLAEIGSRAGNGRLARRALAGAARLAGNDPAALLAVGDSYASVLGEREPALRLYQRARAADGGGRMRGALDARIRALGGPSGG